MILRAAAVWLTILGLAVVNGGIRDTLLAPRLGDTAARAVSTLALSALVLVSTWLAIGWLRPTTAGDALRIGALWLGLTLAFEFLAGRYLFGKSWATLLADYDVTRGRIWILVLVVTFLAPLWAARARGLLGPEGP